MRDAHQDAPRPSQTLVTIPVRNSPAPVVQALSALAGVHWVADGGSGQVRVLFDPALISVDRLTSVALQADAR